MPCRPRRPLYLVPVVMLFGIGNVPGVIVTIVFALPPLVRLTNLGIRQVRPDLIEAARAYGASPMQMLLKVQLPLAMPSVMAGINQSLMLALHGRHCLHDCRGRPGPDGAARHWAPRHGPGPPWAAWALCCWPSRSTASPRPWASRAAGAPLVADRPGLVLRLVRPVAPPAPAAAAEPTDLSSARG